MKKLIFCLLLPLFVSCDFNKEEVDLIVSNGQVYTVDDTFSTARAFAVKDGKFVAVGETKEILNAYTAERVIEADGKKIVPCLIDCH